MTLLVPIEPYTETDWSSGPVIDQIRFALLRRRTLRKKGSVIEPGAYCDSQSSLAGGNRICAGTKLIGSRLGFGSYVGENCSLIRTTVGRFSCIGPKVETVVGSHPVSDFASVHPAFFSGRAQAGFTYVTENLFPEFGERLFEDDKYLISIGSDAWIGHGARIMQGIRVNDGGVIAAGSIVTRDVPAFTIVAGIPAKPLRTRFPSDVVDRLVSTAWWNRDPVELRRLAPKFSNVESLLAELESGS